MIDVGQQIADVQREADTRQLAGGEAQASTISQVYDTDIDDLWDVVTNAERIPRWFLPISGDLVEGGRYQLEGNSSGTITRCDRPNGYAATWEYGGEVSWIEVRLTSEGDGRTRFELEHVGHAGTDFWDQFGPTAGGIGWDMALYGLKGHLTDPESAMDPQAAAEWIKTDDGRRLLRLSADAWAEAYVASGGDRATAQGMADRGYAAYTA